MKNQSGNLLRHWIDIDENIRRVWSGLSRNSHKYTIIIPHLPPRLVHPTKSTYTYKLRRKMSVHYLAHTASSEQSEYRRRLVEIQEVSPSLNLPPSEMLRTRWTNCGILIYWAVNLFLTSLPKKPQTPRKRLRGCNRKSARSSTKSRFAISQEPGVRSLVDSSAQSGLRRISGTLSARRNNTFWDIWQLSQSWRNGRGQCNECRKRRS